MDSRPRIRVRVPLAERFLKKVRVDPESGCWLWIGAFSQKRYGQKRPAIQEGGRGSRVLNAARYACELQNGPPPDSLSEAGHVCPHGERSDCVNPEHLRWMSREENEAYKGTVRHGDTEKLQEEPTT